jgi:predicted metal-dependent hydrolase
MNETSRTISYGLDTIQFQVKFCDRKTLDISVHPNQEVIVKAPSGSALEKVDQRVKEKVRWILKQQEFFSQFDPRTPDRQYVSGETHLYLGRQYRLKVEPSDQECVKLVGRYIQIQTVRSDDRDRIYELLDQWYLHHARIKFRERLEICTQHHEFLDSPCPPLSIRRLSKRWGSLTATGNLILNLDLIRASLSGIDYVITHELCHLKHPNHSPAFYRLLQRVMPDWTTLKTQMEQLLA